MRTLICILFGFASGISSFSAQKHPPRLGLTLGVNTIGIYAEKKLGNAVALRAGGEFVNAISPGISAGLSFNPKLRIFRMLYLEGSLNYSRFFGANSSYEIDNVFLTYNFDPGHYILPQLELAVYSAKGSSLEQEDIFNSGKIHLYVGRTFFLNSVSIKEENQIYNDGQQRILEKRYIDRFVIGISLSFPLGTFSGKNRSRHHN